MKNGATIESAGAFDPPVEVWCRRCDQPSTETVNGEAYCHEHALDQNYRLHSTSWIPSPATTKGPKR
jgi:hypothetical protein